VCASGVEERKKRFDFNEQIEHNGVIRFSVLSQCCHAVKWKSNGVFRIFLDDFVDFEEGFGGGDDFEDDAWLRRCLSEDESSFKWIY
jgi:hypothetical protein